MSKIHIPIDFLMYMKNRTLNILYILRSAAFTKVTYYSQAFCICVLDLRAVDSGSDEQKQEHQGGGGRAKRTRQRDVHLDGAQCSGARYIGRTSIEFFFLSGGFFYFESLRSKR